MIKTLWYYQKKTLHHQYEALPAGRKVLYITLTALALFIMIPFGLGIAAAGDVFSTESLRAVIVYLLLSTLAVITFVTMPRTFQLLFGSKDIEFLFTLPIRSRHLFAMQFFTGWAGFPLLSFLLLTGLSIIIGAVSGAHLLFYPAAALLFFGLSVFGAGLAFLLNLFLVYILPAQRAQQLTTVISFISAALFILAAQMPNIIMQNDNTSLTIEAAPAWLPTQPVAAALFASFRGEGAGVIYAAACLGALAVISLASLWFVEKHYFSSWQRATEPVGNKIKSTRPGAARSVPYAIALKEWRTVQRNPKEWTTCFTFALILILMFINFFGSDSALASPWSNPASAWSSVHVMLGPAILLGLQQFAAAAFGREGDSRWMLRALPVTPRQIVFGKFLAHWVMTGTALAALELIAFLLFGWNIVLVFAGLALTLSLTAVAAASGVWAGASGGTYNEKNPQKRVRFDTGVVSFFLNVLYLLLFFVPTWMILSAGLSLQSKWSGPEPAFLPLWDTAPWPWISLLGTGGVLSAAGLTLLIVYLHLRHGTKELTERGVDYLDP
ncbi:Putative ATP-binding cassette [Marinococcus luteus]|uniref:Putative ATP-binding cassette n=1 Tax=Marinococcus luteus TaxID=1122204 RepID=A0A1H2WH43_9BACI|nr:hypothetical protein [Marinococcus luteus]SDW79920.1 Putative ATP-binding cassette [Marinococcus luteus]